MFWTCSLLALLSSAGWKKREEGGGKKEEGEWRMEEDPWTRSWGGSLSWLFCMLDTGLSPARPASQGVVNTVVCELGEGWDVGMGTPVPFVILDLLEH